MRAEGDVSIPKARLCKNGNLNLNAESKDSKVVAFPVNRAAVACAAYIWQSVLRAVPSGARGVIQADNGIMRPAVRIVL